MDTKSKVLEILKEKEDQFVSGERMAERIGVSRMAISKAVSSLSDQGYKIEAIKHKGYKLDGMSDVLTQESLSSSLSSYGIKCFYLSETVSTNLDAKRLAGEGVKAPFLVATSRQSGGRGRLGRVFESPRGGVYFSLVLSGRDISSPSLVTISAAWAISETMERLTGIKTGIKWVNDVYIGDKKAVGILSEGIVNMEEGGLSEVVIGCGINLKTRMEEFSPEIRDQVTSFFPSGESTVSRCKVISECVKTILEAQRINFLDGYRKRCFVLDKEIYVIRMGEKKKAKALRIDDQGHLVVRYEDSSVEALSSGEVSIRF